MYYVPVHPLPQAVLQYIRKHELLKAGDRVGIVVTGGADYLAFVGLLLGFGPTLGVDVC
jgi:hypothetical protein